MGAYWARNYTDHGDTDAFALEGTYSKAWGSLFGRLEVVEKDELVDVPAGVYRITKFTFGGVKNFAVRNGFEYGVGAYLGVYSFPSSLDSFYGKNPLSIGVFLRVRPAKM